MNINDCYRILRLDKTCTLNEIKEARNEFARFFHPDNWNKEENPEKFKKANQLMTEINLAYETLIKFKNFERQEEQRSQKKRQKEQKKQREKQEKQKEQKRQREKQEEQKRQRDKQKEQKRQREKQEEQKRQRDKQEEQKRQRDKQEEQKRQRDKQEEQREQQKKPLRYFVRSIFAITPIAITLFFILTNNLGNDNRNSENDHLVRTLKEDSIFGRVKATGLESCFDDIYEDDLIYDIYGNIYKTTKGSNPYYSDGSPKGHETQLMKGKEYDILDFYHNSGESQYTLKVKKSNGKIVYIDCHHNIDIINTYGEKGELLSIYLSIPYEYEGDIQLVNKDLAKFEAFLKKYPNSSFTSIVTTEIEYRKRYKSQ